MDLKTTVRSIVEPHLPEDSDERSDMLQRIDRVAEIINERFSGENQAKLGAGMAKNFSDNPMFLQWMLKVVSKLGDRPLEKLLDTFVLGTLIESRPLRFRFKEDAGYCAPFTIVVNPTMRCNIRCQGCYAYNYTKTGDMDADVLRKVLREADEMGVRFITVSGGEPLLYAPLFDIVKEFSNLTFMMYTNGKLIAEETAGRIADAGNLYPAISVEGFAEHTDARRGQGMHESVCRAMDNLKRAGVFFGFSATPTSVNSDVLAQDRFLDYYLDRGALFGWFFNYIPVGREPDTTLMPTPEQREVLALTTRRWQVEKPMFIGDFWNDGAAVGGCLSASRYCNITVEGYVQPCTFVHFYTHKVPESSLREIFDSPFFRAIRDMQPYDQNLLRPCKVIDHPERLLDVVNRFGARVSYEGADQILHNSEVRSFLDHYSREYAPIADRLWEGPHYRKGRDVLIPFVGRTDLYDFFEDRMDQAEQNTEEQETTDEECWLRKAG